MPFGSRGPRLTPRVAHTLHYRDRERSGPSRQLPALCPFLSAVRPAVIRALQGSDSVRGPELPERPLGWAGRLVTWVSVLRGSGCTRGRPTGPLASWCLYLPHQPGSCLHVEVNEGGNLPEAILTISKRDSLYVGCLPTLGRLIPPVILISIKL